ncbi:nuclear envelope pore membrane protein POM 121-like isoform X2 [Girardinichthys multiradiatus]|uniref:nuclear envelope pore membrane protein POM 121-like isoform X2 n=1 Tax=Girardinichthys multiradiatus TaxID=208333 RepID=UPI001FAB7EC6|nr:nuclear envelope pore membrane protein POM 121-like isoform X2 [Girardinichthys multiradiatus]
MDDLDALLADLESTTSHISKRPVFLPDETPYSIPTGGFPNQDVSVPPPVPPPPSADALNGSLADQPDSHHSSQQSLGSGHKSSWSRDSSSSPLSHIEEDHVYSFPNKHKTSDLSPAAMTSALGSNLSELDRLLLELNAVQQSSPSFPTTEEAAPPLPSCSITHYENGGAPDILVSPPLQEKPKRNGMRLEEAQPLVESLLEGSGLSPSSSTGHNDLDTSSQQQTRMSASCATRELDELMASLSDFKPSSLGFLPDQAGTPSTSHHSPAPSSITPVASSSLSLPHPPVCSFLPLSAGFELHIDEDGKDCGSVMPHPSLLGPHSPSSSFSAASDIDLDSVIDVSATMLSSQTKSLLVLCQSAPSNSSLLGNSPSLSNITTPSLTSVNTVLEHKTPTSPSPSAERLSPSVSKVFCASECIGQRPACFLDHDFDFTSPPLSKSCTPPLSTPSPLSAAGSASQSSLHFPSKPYSPSAVSPLMIPSPLIFTSTSRQLSEVSPGVQRDTPLTLQQPTAVEPSLDEALDKLLAMSFAQSHASHLEEQLEKMEAHSLDKELQEVQEELILPMDRRCIQPDTFTSTTNTITEDSIDIGTDGNGDLDWADEELSMSLHDGLDGTMTPFTERLYTDGSMTPLTEASWMDESMTPSSCPGTPDVALDLPLLQAPSIDRVSATGHVRICNAVLFWFRLLRLIHLYMLASASGIFINIFTNG